MKISELIEELENMKDVYGDIDTMISLRTGVDGDFNPTYVTQHGHIKFTYFQKGERHDILIIGD